MKIKSLSFLIITHLCITIYGQEVNIRMVNGYNFTTVDNFQMKLVDENGKLVDTVSSDQNGNIKYDFKEPVELSSNQEMQYFRSFPVSISERDLGKTVLFYFYPTPEAEIKIRSWEEKHQGFRLEELSSLNDAIAQNENHSNITANDTLKDTIVSHKDSNIIEFDKATEPIFPGGIEKMHEYLSENILYPDVSINNAEEGKVFVKFIVEKNGLVSQIEVVRGVSPAIDAESIRVIRNMPKWIPAEEDGKTCRIKLHLPINFSLR